MIAVSGWTYVHTLHADFVEWAFPTEPIEHNDVLICFYTGFPSCEILLTFLASHTQVAVLG